MSKQYHVVLAFDVSIVDVENSKRRFEREQSLAEYNRVERQHYVAREAALKEQRAREREERAKKKAEAQKAKADKN